MKKCRGLPPARYLVLTGLASLYVALQVILWQKTTNSDGDSTKTSTTTTSAATWQGDDPPSLLALDLDAEARRGVEYARAFAARSKPRELRLVHIPKAAGSALEEAAGTQAKVSWGSCLFDHRPRRPGGWCVPPAGRSKFEWPRKVGYWHLPPQLFPLLGSNPYEGSDLFVVLRDPRDKLVSEFLYVCHKSKNRSWDTKQVDCNQTSMDDPRYMNEWITDKIRRLPTGQDMMARDYLDQNGHYTPQSQFIFADNGVRMVDYVLRMEDLSTELPRLMKAFGMNVKLAEKKGNTERDLQKDLDARAIGPELDALIREKYHHDLEMMPLGNG